MATVRSAGQRLGARAVLPDSPNGERGMWEDDVENEQPWTRVVRTEALVDGRMATGRRGVTRLVVVRIRAELRVFVDRCPHAGAPLSTGKFNGTRVTCDRHHWSFDCRSGACLDNPVYQLRLWEVRERDGWVEARPPASEVW